ncbi:hypothetical protein AVEN_78857-1 [Araneus ventricosus]|uniref:Uncharacterized protein n=1 Tax=Araneus ventricosus TaxID=182803 RepID=A0A4Y2V6F7_ARAVE|nr:hypothetical protein AVEN_78857-1 [Araneus ventricosus]
MALSWLTYGQLNSSTYISRKGERVCFPLIPSDMQFDLKCFQFPDRFAFAVTTDKTQVHLIKFLVSTKKLYVSPVVNYKLHVLEWENSKQSAHICTKRRDKEKAVCPKA